MKKLGIVLLVLGVVFLVGHWIFSGNTYFIDEAWVLHTSFPIGASFLFGAGVALLLTSWNLDRQRKGKVRDRKDEI